MKTIFKAKVLQIFMVDLLNIFLVELLQIFMVDLLNIFLVELLYILLVRLAQILFNFQDLQELLYSSFIIGNPFIIRDLFKVEPSSKTHGCAHFKNQSLSRIVRKLLLKFSSCTSNHREVLEGLHYGSKLEYPDILYWGEWGA